MAEKIKPVCVLALVAAIISGLVIVVYNLTYVDTSNIVTDKQAAAAIHIYGGVKEDYSVVPAEEYTEKLTNAGITSVSKVIKKNDGSLAIECLVKGYKSGFDIMVGVKDNKVARVAIVSVGEETPGLGTKTNDPDFLDRFKEKTGKVTIVKSAPSADNEVQGITSATLSSRGVAKAVNDALDAYKLIGGEAQ